MRNENSKSQIPNIKQITMTKIQNSKPVLVIEYWNLRFVCNLVLGVWDFTALHHSRRLPQEGKEHSNPLRSLPEDGSFAPGVFTFGVVQ
jgi:hypothetical protein